MTSLAGRPSIFWWLLSLVLTRPRLGSLESANVAQNATLEPSERSAGDSNQAKKGASTWTRSNYPPFRTTGCTAGEPTTRGARAKGLHWANPYDALEIHAAHFHTGTSI